MQFEDICRDNYARIYNYILAKTGVKEAAEDITQDVFLIAWQKGDAFLRHEKPVAFLYTTAANLVLAYFREARKSAAKEKAYEESKASATGRDAFEELCLHRSDSVREESCLKQVLSGLKPKERDLYRKYYIEKKPMKTIAREFQMSETAIRMKYVRIRKKVQRIVADMRLDDF